MHISRELLICVTFWASDSYSFVVNSGAGITTGNFPLATTKQIQTETSWKSRYERGVEDYDEAMEQARQSRGMSLDDHDIIISDHDHHPTEKMVVEQKAVASDPWTNYADFIINEGSFKFWSIFQLLTAILLLYSAFAAAYYAKFNVITTDYDYYDDFLGRSNSDSSSSLWSGLSSSTFQRIFDAISSKKFT